MAINWPSANTDAVLGVLAGTAIGAALDRKMRLRGALIGGTVGGVTGYGIGAGINGVRASSHIPSAAVKAMRQARMRELQRESAEDPRGSTAYQFGHLIYRTFFPENIWNMRLRLYGPARKLHE